jgi:hypothetical protein
MSDALLTGSFALAGVVVSGVLALVGYSLKTRHELRKDLQIRHFERRLELYDRVARLAAPMYQTNSRQPTLEEVPEINKDLILLGSPEVISAFNRVVDVSADKLHHVGMTEDQVRTLQTTVARDLFNAIRVDLYPGQRPLPPESIRFIEPKKTPPNNVVRAG